MEPRTFLGEPPATADAQRLYDEDVESDGYVGNLTRVWAWRPDVLDAFTQLRAQLAGASSLAPREVAVLVAATASARGDAYCALAWGTRLAAASDPETAAQVLAERSASALTPREAALATWARAVVRDPNRTTADDVERLREVGFEEREIFEATTLIAFRLAFSTVNDALGAAPDQQLAAEAPEAVRAAVAFGRRPT